MMSVEDLYKVLLYKMQKVSHLLVCGMRFWLWSREKVVEVVDIVEVFVANVAIDVVDDVLGFVDIDVDLLDVGVAFKKWIRV